MVRDVARDNSARDLNLSANSTKFLYVTLRCTKNKIIKIIKHVKFNFLENNVQLIGW